MLPNKLSDLGSDASARYTTKKECIVCFNEMYCEMLANGLYASIIDLERINNNGYVFLSCCLKDDHFICKRCLRSLALNFDNHMINNSNSRMYCPYMGGCVYGHDYKNYFNHGDISKVLSRDEFLLYSRHAQRFKNPGFESLKCTKCSNTILVSKHDINRMDSGSLAIYCDKYLCSAKFCYTCKNDVGIFQSSCKVCEIQGEKTNPHAFNKYFYKPLDNRNAPLHDQENYFFRNSELNTEIVLTQISEIVTNEYVRCPICLVKMYKSEQCNGMAHCGAEVCYVCNRKSTEKLHDHWSEEGRLGCYRFESSPILQRMVPDYECVDGLCFGHDIGECKNEDHVDGAKKMVEFRKKNIIYHMLKSLQEPFRDSLIETMREKDEYKHIRKFLTYNYNYTNYFDYLPPDMLEEYNRLKTFTPSPGFFNLPLLPSSTFNFSEPPLPLTFNFLQNPSPPPSPPPPPSSPTSSVSSSDTILYSEYDDDDDFWVI